MNGDPPPNPIRKRRFQDSHVHPKLRGQVYDVLSGIGACLDQHLAIPALMLIYSGIDGMAYVSRPTIDLTFSGQISKPGRRHTCSRIPGYHALPLICTLLVADSCTHRVSIRASPARATRGICGTTSAVRSV
jgi:hypothetical protein